MVSVASSWLEEKAQLHILKLVLQMSEPWFLLELKVNRGPLCSPGQC